MRFLYLGKKKKKSLLPPAKHYRHCSLLKKGIIVFFLRVCEWKDLLISMKETTKNAVAPFIFFSQFFQIHRSLQKSW